jgi:Rad3-related DNA helicase
MAEEFAALPLDFVAVHGAGEALEVLPFVAGTARPGVRPTARLVLHAETHPDTLQDWCTAGAVCIPAGRLMELLAPEETARVFTSAHEVGQRYVRATCRLRPHGEILAAAAAALPESEAALRALLHRGIAALAVASLGAAAAHAAAPCPASGPLGGAPATAPLPPKSPFAGPALPAHELLDRLFEHLHAWRRADGAVPFEPRAGQAAMAHAVLEALEGGESLLVEAGTGVGKTIAYVLPMLLLAATRGGRFVIATHTHNLQHQLVQRDLPELWRCFALDHLRRPDGAGAGLRFAKLLGRANYVCRTALTRASRHAAASGGDFGVAQALLALLRTTSGEIAEIAPWLEPRLRVEVQSRRETCHGGACRGDTPCPVFVARETARHADLVVVNHALLFSDAATEGSILGRGAGLVVDEAHHLEAVATEHLTIRVGRGHADALAAPVARVQAAAFGSPTLVGMTSRFTAFAAQVAALRHRMPAFFDGLGGALPAAGARRGRQAYHDGDEVFASVEVQLSALLADLGAIAREAEALQEECAPFVEDPDAQECAAGLGLVAALGQETAAGLDFLTTAGREEYAFFLEFGSEGSTILEIGASPLDVAPEVQRLLRIIAPAVVYTSATLAVGGDFGYFRQRAGVGSQAACLEVPSPFDYAAQCLAVQAQYLCDYGDASFEPQVAELLAEIVRRTGRRMLVLLTSHAALRRLHAELLRRLGPRSPVLAQEVSGSRAQLAARFVATPGAVLLGTASFWEGMDFPGSGLEVLAIAKLPFLVPDEPLVAARSERLRRRGDDPFVHYVLPEAVLRFKQGFGRLVRSRLDRGALLLLDSRLGERHYGAEFVAALPVTPEVFHAPEPLVERVVAWLETNGTG